MNYFKECILTMLEIGLAIYILVFGYAVWDNFVLNDLYIAEANDKTREVQVYSDNNILTLHNVAKQNNETTLYFKINKIDLENLEEINLYLENEIYNIKEQELLDNKEYYLIKLKNINLLKYETIYYDYSINIEKEYLLDYDFYIETI